MNSKQLNSILNSLPSATATGKHEMSKKQFADINYDSSDKLNTERIVATIPTILKNEIKDYIKSHRGETERIVILRSLKLMGFNVPEEWLIDKRKMR